MNGTQRAPLRVHDLSCEYQRNPLGIDIAQPRLGWKLVSDRPAAVQTAFQIRVMDGERTLWDTRRVNSDQSIHVPYGGPALQSGQHCVWQVRVWDSTGRVSEWSEPARWEMGLLHASDWRASWIEPDWDEDPSEFNPAPFMRATFALREGFASARVYVTAHGLYELFLNGCRVGDACLTPGYTSYPRRLQYQTYDVRDLLREGENTVGVILGDGWWRGKVGAYARRNVYGERLGLLLQLVVRYGDGREVIIVSDEGWRATTGPILKSDLQDGEVYDARLEIPGWNQPDFDAGNWRGVRVASDDLANLVAPIGPPVRRKEHFVPVAILTTPNGETVVDLGQNFSGVLQLTVSGPAGATVRLRHGETLDKDGNFTMEHLEGPHIQAPLQEVQYTLKGEGEEVFTPHFTTHGFRYVKVEGFPGTPMPANFLGIALYSDMPETGTFHCSDPRINQLHHNILWSEKSNFVEIPTDCPTRERAGWTGDAQIFARTGSFLMQTAGFFTKWLHDLAVEQEPDGRVPNLAPNLRNELVALLEGSAGWGDAATIVPWTLYQVFGDERILREQYASMKAWVEYQRRHSRHYLWNTSIHWGEWLEPDAPTLEELSARMAPEEMQQYMTHPHVATAYFAHSAHLVSETARILGMVDDAREYASLCRHIKEAYVGAFVEPDGRMLPDTQATYVRALAFDLLPHELRAPAARRLVELIEQSNMHLATGFLSTPFLCHVLSETGHLDIAYALLEQDTPPSWLYEVKKGATTVWEHWNAIDEDGQIKEASLNHYSPGAIGSWLYEVVAGIELGAPGYKHVVFRPRPGGGLTSVAASYRSLYGEIASRWHIEDGTFSLVVTMPANISGTVVIPARAGAEVVANGESLETAKGIRAVKREPDATHVEVGSGTYTFVIKEVAPRG